MPDCIIVAAGRSSRMKKWKPGLPWKNGKTMSEHVVRVVLEAGCRTILVGGYRYSRLKRLFNPKRLTGNNDVTLVRARNWRKGMDESLRAGLLQVHSNRFFVIPVDMPLINAVDFCRLAEEFVGDAIRPVYRGVPGHPVLFADSTKPLLYAGTPGTPFKTILKQLNINTIEWKNNRVVTDIDTPEDYYMNRPEK